MRNDGYGNVETITGIEELWGTYRGDSFTGNSADNSFYGQRHHIGARHGSAYQCRTDRFDEPDPHPPIGWPEIDANPWCADMCERGSADFHTTQRFKLPLIDGLTDR